MFNTFNTQMQELRNKPKYRCGDIVSVVYDEEPPSQKAYKVLSIKQTRFGYQYRLSDCTNTPFDAAEDNLRPYSSHDNASDIYTQREMSELLNKNHLPEDWVVDGYKKLRDNPDLLDDNNYTDKYAKEVALESLNINNSYFNHCLSELSDNSAFEQCYRHQVAKELLIARNPSRVTDNADTEARWCVELADALIKALRGDDKN